MCACSCSGSVKNNEGSVSSSKKDEDKKVLVAYFSATGTTKAVAEKLAAASGGDLFEIAPATPYSAADLDWHNPDSRSSVEMKNPEAREALKDSVKDLSHYNAVLIGYPIWWDLAPTAVNTFIESNNFKGKRVALFATSGSSPIDNSASVLEKLYPQIKWEPAQLLNSPTEEQITDWLDSVLN